MVNDEKVIGEYIERKHKEYVERGFSDIEIEAIFNTGSAMLILCMKEGIIPNKITKEAFRLLADEMDMMVGVKNG